MSVRDRHHDAVELELDAERAAALGRIAGRMEEALEALRAFDAAGEAEAVTRDELLAAAAEWVWFYVVQRESLGWYRHEEALRAYHVPSEVHLQMGPRRRRGPAT